MSLLDLFQPPKPPKPENVSLVHELFGKQIPPAVAAKWLTPDERRQREIQRKRDIREKERKKRWSERRSKLRAELRAAKK